MKVRIGNDIRLQVQLNYGQAQDPVNILSLKAVFVNKTLEKQFIKEYKKKNRFMYRFPIEPFTNEFQSTAYNLNSSGNPRYRAYVMNQYSGFGVYPDWSKQRLLKKMNITEYTSEVQRTSDASSIIATFPASAQLYTGQYDLIVIAQVEDPGYKNNVRTATIDYKNVFELVKTTEESDVEEAVHITIDNNTDSSPRQDYYVVSGSYNNNEILLRRNDNAVIHVDIDPISGWYEEPEED